MSPRYFIAMAEHSMCQPGRPGPRRVSQDVSPGLVAFQRAKSRAESFSYSSESMRAPSWMPSRSLPESLPYSGKLRDAEVPGAVFGLVGDVLGGEALDERRPCSSMFSVARAMASGRSMPSASDVFEEGLFVPGGVVADGLAGGGGVADDLVVDVGDVHDVADGRGRAA